MDLLLDCLVKLQTDLSDSSSSKQKVAILCGIKENHDLVKLIKYIYDPDMKFNVTSENVLKYKTKQILMISKISIFKLLDDLYSRKITGHTALEHIIFFTRKLTEEQKNVFMNILDKDLKVGINIKIINKSLDNLIPEFSVALGQVYSENFVKDNNWLISRKMDGIRCITIIKEDSVRFFSRTGKELFVFDTIKSEIRDRTPRVLDGEMIKIINGKEDFQSMMKEIHRKNHTVTDAYYKVFDVLTLEEFWAKKGSMILSDRLKTFNYKSTHIDMLEQCGYDCLDEMAVKSKGLGWEGLIVRKNGNYKGGRSKDILKVKEFFTEEYTVVGVESGKMRCYNKEIQNYQEIETLSAVHIKHQGFDVRVGSGFSMEERKIFHENPDEIIGKLISVRYFEETTDQKGNCSLRFPTFKGVYGDTRNY
jgi:DNA ligase-1